MSQKVKKNIHPSRESQLYGEVRRLRRELSDTLEGAQQMSRALDGVVAAIVRQCGSRQDDGFVLRLPAVKLREKYAVTAGVDGDDYVITVLPAPTDGDGSAGGAEDKKPVG